MFVPFLQGFGVGGGLIVAIGAQNAFLLSQSVKRNHHLLIALLYILSDALLVGLGVTSVGSAIARSQILGDCAAVFGAVFLGVYGWGAFRRVFRQNRMETEEGELLSMQNAILATLAVTYLNPHVYLDTIVLMGSVSGQLETGGRLFFWMGCVCASTVWFALLAFGGQALAPLFKKPAAWRILDGGVCLTMWFIAAMLLQEVLETNGGIMEILPFAT